MRWAGLDTSRHLNPDFLRDKSGFMFFKSFGILTSKAILDVLIDIKFQIVTILTIESFKQMN